MAAAGGAAFVRRSVAMVVNVLIDAIAETFGAFLAHVIGGVALLLRGRHDDRLANDDFRQVRPGSELSREAW